MDHEQAKERHDKLKLAYYKTFKGKLGKEVIADLKNKLHYNRTTYNMTESVDNTIFREGQRSVVLHILDMLKDV